MRWYQPLLYLWALPGTAIGLLLAPIVWLQGGSLRVVDGVLEMHGGIVTWALIHVAPIAGGAAAVTLGHVVIGRDAHALQWSREHERVHVRQYERWGPAFIPAYLLSSLYLYLRGRDFYYDNPFEKEAYETAKRR